MSSSACLLRESLGRECRVLSRSEGRTAIQIEEKYIPAIQLEAGDTLLGYAEYIGSVVALLGSAGNRYDQAELYCMIPPEERDFLLKVTSRYEVSCGAVIYRQGESEKEYLIIRAKKGHTGFPKGHRENEETPRENALREIREETGLNPVLLEGFQTENHYFVDKKIEKHVIYFIAREEKQEEIRIQPEEVLSAAFYPFEEALLTLTHRQDKEILKQAAAFLKEADL